MAGWGGRSAQRLRARALELYGDTCHLCGQPGADTVDHVVPRNSGGDNSLDNLRPAHKSCNSARKDMPLSHWRALKNPQRYRGAAPPSREW